MSQTLKLVKTIRSHVGVARFHAELADEPVGEIPRQVNEPYRSGPTHVVWSWNGMLVIICEVRHRHYEVFQVMNDAKDGGCRVKDDPDYGGAFDGFTVSSDADGGL